MHDMCALGVCSGEIIIFFFDAPSQKRGVMNATEEEKKAVRDLCLVKRKLMHLDRETKAKRKKWNDHVKSAKEALDELLPDDTCFKVGSKYIRRDVYNRMLPIEIKKVKTMLSEIRFRDIERHPKFTSDGDVWPVFLDVLKTKINADRNRKGEYVHMTTRKPRGVRVLDAPRDVLEIATLQERAKAQLSQIAEAAKPRRNELKTRMSQLEPDVMRFMTRTTKEKQRVRIGDTLSGGGNVNHNFSILRKSRSTKQKITMDHVFRAVSDVVGHRRFRDFESNRSRLVVRIGQILSDIVQPETEFYLQLRSSGIRAE